MRKAIMMFLIVLLSFFSACGSANSAGELEENGYMNSDKQGIGFELSTKEISLCEGETTEIYVETDDKSKIVAGIQSEGVISVTWNRDEAQVTNKITLFVSALEKGESLIVVSDGITEESITVNVIQKKQVDDVRNTIMSTTIPTTTPIPTPIPTVAVKEEKVQWSNGVYTYTDELGRELFYFEAEEYLYQVAEELLKDENGVFTVRRKESIWGKIIYEVVGTKEEYYGMRDEDTYLYFGSYKNYLPNGIGMLVQIPIIEADEVYEMEFVYYLGSFEDGEMSGYGIKYRVPDTDYYYIYYRECLSDWKNTAELPWGEEALEKLYYKEYEGGFKNGKYDGIGNKYYNYLEMDYSYSTALLLEYGSDETYEVVPFDRFMVSSGEFSKGVLNGYGTSYLADGSVIHSGLWEDGEAVEEENVIVPNY